MQCVSPPYQSTSSQARRRSVNHDEMMMCQKASFAFKEEIEFSPSAAPQPPIASLVTKASENMASATFEIPRPATILSDNQEHKVTVAIIELETRFSYAVVAARSPHSFLKSTTTNGSQYFILQGPCNIFMDNNFVAKSELKDVAPQEDFAFYLGPDKGVKVEYKQPSEVKDQSGLFSKSNLQTWTSQVTVKNTKSKPIAVVIYEQLPISSDEKIKVTLVEPDIKKSDNVKINPNNNIEWRYHIDAGKSRVVPCKYTVESPVNLQLHYDWA
eukprot:TRINITY_DN5506_c0_g1_i2.p2 TRINITY_DN5506_c0_g1~~TRINITY_DN5506_c0_g1_i2.p2  ORF type:complete len:271 (+),score=67.13 TRINITY_DN5506_c0_g1_i2:992-1804(+)